nr:glycosyltransferase family 2 protein [uncultured Carboxylicivirga sp.]
MESTKDPFFISIIIPTYNCETVIQSAINSIIEQTFTNYELICIDGKSTDQTLKIIKENALKHTNISFVSEPDNGIYDAMNKGIQLAKGTYIYFLGADDRLYSNKTLELVYQQISQTGGDLIYGNVMVNNTVYDGEFSYRKMFNKNICHQAIFYHKQIFSKYLYNTHYKSLADWDFNLRCFANHLFKIKYFDQIIAYYNNDGFSISYDDTEFTRTKKYRYIKYGWRILPCDFTILQAKNIYKNDQINKRQKAWILFIYTITKIKITLHLGSCN